MNSPPEALSPSPSTPSSGSPSPDDNVIPQPTPLTPSNTFGQIPTASPKRRLPPSSASVFAGRENKSRRRDGAWDSVRTGSGEASGGGSSLGAAGGRMREELVDVHMVEYVRNAYGDPFDDTMLEKRNKSS